MKDSDFNKIRMAFETLKNLECDTIVFNLRREQEIRSAIEERYNDVPKDLKLKGIDIIFI